MVINSKLIEDDGYLVVRVNRDTGRQHVELPPHVTVDAAFCSERMALLDAASGGVDGFCSVKDIGVRTSGLVSTNYYILLWRV